ncbi:hypothetical protein LTR95_004477 [Oleoguttula sp. CCFEE 5521]
MSQANALTESLIERNKKYAAENHKPMPLLHGADGKLRRGTGVLVVTCLDPRIVPEVFLGFRQPGFDPIALPVVRVIGGRAKHAVTNIVGLDAAFGIDMIFIVHHTGKLSVVYRVIMQLTCLSDCGLTHNTDVSLKATLKDKLPGETARVEELSFHAIAQLGESVSEDMQYLREHPLIKKNMTLRGFLYHIHSGLLEEKS